MMLVLIIDAFHIPENIKIMFLVVLLINLCFDNKYSKDVVLYRGKNAVLKFIKSVLKEHGYCKKLIKKYFNKKLIMTAEENELFEMTNICWICGKLNNCDDKLEIIVM